MVPPPARMPASNASLDPCRLELSAGCVSRRSRVGRMSISPGSRRRKIRRKRSLSMAWLCTARLDPNRARDCEHAAVLVEERRPRLLAAALASERPANHHVRLAHLRQPVDAGREASEHARAAPGELDGERARAVERGP